MLELCGGYLKIPWFIAGALLVERRVGEEGVGGPNAPILPVLIRVKHQVQIVRRGKHSWRELRRVGHFLIHRLSE